MSSVLYDTPGPRAKARNLIVSVVFAVALAAGVWWLVSALGDKGHLEWAKWKPFTESSSWTVYLLPGLGNTLKAAALAMIIALPLGAVFGIARLSDHAWVRIPAGTVVEFFRAIPVLILMVFANELYSGSVEPDVRPLYAVVTGLVLYNASVLAEIVRAGILSLPSGQAEAGRAIGLRKSQTMRFILLPQAVTAMLPAIVSQLVVIVKDTALGGAMIGFTELLRSRGTMSAFYGNTIPSFIVVAVIFVVLNLILTTFASWLEKWLRNRKKSSGAVLGAAAIEDAKTVGAKARLGTSPDGGAGGSAV
ncbi:MULTISPECIES: amino acid ABC transporter permease [Streptomyces]|uniref:Amino acid ABC transporter permease n=1 Tax=Streptomyces odorifer TaxID=53450 RepID=A0A7Y6CCU4_9ACTN|nr:MULTISPECIES: amino acid ABC transporter permease [Streptomyces albidoflavus group]MCR0991114.1 amino acid ABC transporter permease [Streptomyces albidoflavus]NUV30577.1 amino acid ABC transporter permease [Streptomyces odorifer]NUV33309.1 amino acid ABC transporter permease [Streptomyces sp. KAI-27]NUV47193.1 amino acid ABC transporter permease [Streptomyces sp. CAI-78]